MNKFLNRKEIKKKTNSSYTMRNEDCTLYKNQSEKMMSDLTEK